MVQIDEEDADDAQWRTASSFAWSLSTIDSCRGGETLPVMEAASAFFDAVGLGST
jgi:hypothetical protein